MSIPRRDGDRAGGPPAAGSSSASSASSAAAAPSDASAPSVPARSTDPDLVGLDDRAVWQRYAAVDNDLAAQTDPDVPTERVAAERDRLLTELVARHPEHPAFWYDLGMAAKWRRDWPASLAANRRALDLLEGLGGRESLVGEPAAWNLGIAATALRDWRTARRAWTAFGVGLPAATDEAAELVADFGPAPVRLNPAARFVGEAEPAGGDTEVVWGQRICPARVRILSVPTSGTGRRFGDVVLHDGDPVGSRVLDGRTVGVFNEIGLWQRSSLATLTATVDAPGAGDVEDLAERVEAAGLGVEDWTASLRMLCKACSERDASGDGPDDQAHDHEHVGPGDGWNTLRTMAFGGRTEQLRPILEDWSRSGRGRAWTDLEVVLR